MRELISRKFKAYDGIEFSTREECLEYEKKFNETAIKEFKIELYAKNGHVIDNPDDAYIISYDASDIDDFNEFFKSISSIALDNNDKNVIYEKCLNNYDQYFSVSSFIESIMNSDIGNYIAGYTDPKTDILIWDMDEEVYRSILTDINSLIDYIILVNKNDKIKNDERYINAINKLKEYLK